MSLYVIIFANHPRPPQSLVHVCLEKVLGDPVLLWQLRALPAETKHAWVITGDDHEKTTDLVNTLKVCNEIDKKVECVQNPNPLALLESQNIEPSAHFLLFDPSQPLISTADLQKLITNGASAAILTSPETSHYDFLDPYLISWDLMRGILDGAGNSWERLLSELREMTSLFVNGEAECCLQVRTRMDLVEIQKIARKRIVNQWLGLGVVFMDPDSTFVGPRVEFSKRGVTVEPQVRLEGRVTVGVGTTIGQGTIVRNTSIGSNVEIRPYCVINDALIGDGSKIGPFAHLREGTHLDSDVRLGNFVETKKAHLHSGAKANHLSYLGDCEIGERSNIGAGCITCNYDGFSKHRTVIGNDAFIGSDCQLIAPVTIGNGAILGAGTTLTTDVPEDALVLTRPETKILNGGAKKLRAKLVRGS